MQTTPKSLALDSDHRAANDTPKVVPEIEVGHYSTGATVTLWNTGGMAPGGTDGKASFGRKVYMRTAAPAVELVAMGWPMPQTTYLGDRTSCSGRGQSMSKRFPTAPLPCLSLALSCGARQSRFTEPGVHPSFFQEVWPEPGPHHSSLPRGLSDLEAASLMFLKRRVIERAREKPLPSVRELWRLLW